MLTACWANLFLTDLTVKWRSSRSNNSATRATVYKRICVCESPRDKLCHKQNFMSKFEVSEFCRAFEFLDWGGGSHSAIVILPYLKEYLEYWDKQYSIWKLVNRAFICVQYYGLTRLCCWVIDCCLSARLYRADRGPFSVWHSSVNISATRTSFAMILDAYESPTHRLSYVVPFI